MKTLTIILIANAYHLKLFIYLFIYPVEGLIATNYNNTNGLSKSENRHQTDTERGKQNS